MKRSVCFSVLLMLLCVPGVVAQYGTYETYDVPYVPTDLAIVNEMLSMAQVTGDDLLYDLGCGDGRIVNTAAYTFGTHGIGIDINPVRIEESTENAEKMGVTDRVTFIEQNLFETDFSDATVVTLYLLQSVNLRLRPTLLRDLRPGTRVVSHSFSMDEWEPDARSEVMSNGYAHRIYFWVVPANLSGDWEWRTGSPGSQHIYHLSVTQSFQHAAGTLLSDDRPIVIKDVVINGATISFTTEQTVDGETVTSAYAGTAEQDRISGTISVHTPAGAYTMPWQATRDPETAVPLDHVASIE